MPLLIAAGLFVTLMVAISAFGYGAYARPGRMYQQLGNRAAAPVRTDLLMPEKKRGPSPLVELMNQVGGLMPISPGDAALTRKDLEAAGYRSENALQIYYGLRIVLAAGLLVTAFLLRQQLTAR